jgi:Ras-related GTP-binding protein A/B
VTLDFPSPTFSSITQRESIPQVLSSAHAIVYCMKDPEDDNIRQLPALLQNCELTPRLFVILHKIDLIEARNQGEHIQAAVETANQNGIPRENCFATSLFDGSLARAFSQMIARLLPTFARLKHSVDLIASALKNSRVVVLDGATFLPICDSNPEKPDQHQPVFDFFLRVHPRRNPIKTICFESNGSAIVYTVLSRTTGIFVVAGEPTVTTDAILFNLRRAIPVLSDLVTLPV